MTHYHSHPLVHGQAPTWASSWGQDRYGVFVGFQVGEMEQVMRWIPPATFWMGSPEEEADRFSGEGPRHLVTLSEGFWLGETPCTQALWEEVMGANPSRFKSPERPVETVSWQDCQEFLERLEVRIPGLEPRLPSEEEWEHACRAQTEGATWLGDLEILGANNAPALDSIAWYGGNSGVEFDLDNGVDSSGWPEKQHDFRQAGTRKVSLKKPNPWGLYDMLGNVYEWCSDIWCDDYDSPRKGPLRVVRGGSWDYLARYVRAADRGAYEPSYRGDALGFRLARGQ